MDMPINAAVQCTDGPGGHMTHIILNPVSRTITDLVVREPWLLGGEVVVPVRYIINSTPETVCLRLARRDLAGMQSFLRTLFISPGGDVSPDDRAWIDRPPTTAMLSPY